MPRSRTRKKQQQIRARRTQAQQRGSDKQKLSPRAYRTQRILGWSLVVASLIVGVSQT